MKTEIFKLQTPIFGPRNADALLYNEDESICCEVPIDKGVKLLMGAKKKIYVHAYVKNNQFKVTGIAPAQEW